MQPKTTSLLVLALAFAAGSGAALAQDAAKPVKTLSPQQSRMVECNKQATGKSGDERKAFMSTCLKGGTATTAKATQQDKMKSCSADAKTQGLKGAERKTFMSTCLKGTEAAPAA